MKVRALNRKERRKANIQFIAMFSALLLLIFSCSFFVLRVAGEGVNALESKHSTYRKAFQNQALATFKIEEIIDKIYSLKMVERTINEQKNLQGLISNIRMDIEKMVKDEETDLEELALYEQLLEQISVLQTSIDIFERDEESRSYSQQLLERCREKYKEDRLKEGRGEKDEEK